VERGLESYRKVFVRIALLYPLWTEEYGSISKFARKAGKWPPLNLAYLAAYAEAMGHEVCIIDGEAQEISIEQIGERVKAFGAELIGITATTPFYHIATQLAAHLKSIMDAPVVIGGPHVSVLREKAFLPPFDYAFIKEADTSWQHFLNAITYGGNINDVRGIMFRVNHHPYFTGDATTFSDINRVPFPARHLLKNHLYRLGTMRGTKRFTTIMTVRGCPFDCIFCSTNVFGKDTRRRTPALVIEEMKWCVKHIGTEHFMFLDDTLTMHRKHILEICERMIDAKLSVTFEGSTRANLVDEALISKMVEAGLVRISFGLESVDETIRQTMKKNVPLESYVAANQITNRYGVETLNSCMIGLPGETRETVRKTLAFLRQSREIKQANISIAVPYPGTELFDLAKRGEMGLKLMTEDFSKYRRYNAAVLTVGDLTPNDLMQIQNEAFASIYLAPWRWLPMIHKSGLAGAWLTLKRLIRCLWTGKTQYLTNRQLGI